MCIEWYPIASRRIQKFQKQLPGNLWARSCSFLFINWTDVAGMFVGNRGRNWNLLMVKKGIKGEICHALQSFAKPNSKYMKDYDMSTESS